MIIMINFVKNLKLIFIILVILLLTQNGYKINHIVLDSKKNEINQLNEYYTKYEITADNSKRLNFLIADSNVVVINDLENFEKFSNLQKIRLLNKKEGQFPLILNQKFEVFMPSLNNFYTIFDDKQMLAFSGVLSSLRPYKEYSPPVVPRVNIFVN